MGETVANSLQRPVINIEGERVSLGPFTEEHLEAFHHWHNDYETMRTWLLLPGPVTHAQSQSRHEYWATQSDWTSFAIYENATWRHIGVTLFIDISHIDRTAEFGIMIGAPEARGKGYGTEATRLMLDHAFLALGLSNVILRVYEYNIAGIRAYEKVGFRTIGTRRKSKMMGGKLWDTIYMEALADEFESPVLGKILVPDQPR